MAGTSATLAGRVTVPAGDPVLTALANAALGIAGADTTGVLLLDEAGETARMGAWAGDWTVHSANLTVRRGRGLAGRILETRRPWKVDDYACDRSIKAEEFMPVLVEEHTVAGLGAPLLVDDVLVGVVMAWSKRRGAFDVEATRALVNLADLAALAIVRGRAADAVRRDLAEADRRAAELADRTAVHARGEQLRGELVPLLLAGRGLAELLGTVCAHTGGDAVLFDSRLDELGACGAVGPVRDRVVAHVRRSRSESDTTLPPAPGFPRWTLLRSVDADGVRLARLALCLPRVPDAGDRVTATEAVAACAIHLTRERAVLDARSRVHADFVGQLLDGLVDEAVAVVRARQLDCPLPARLRVVAIPVRLAGDDGGLVDEEARRLDQLVDVAERLARGAGAGVLAGRRGATVALVVDSAVGSADGAADEAADAAADDVADDAADDSEAVRALAEHVVRGLRRHAPGAVGRAGVSACVEWSADLRGAYRQAEQALAAEAPGGGPVVLFDDLGLLRFLLAPCDRADQQRFVRTVLGAVLDYDREHHTDLVATLGTYLDEGGSLTRTATSLYVHPKTVRYRLRRVEELAHRDLSGQRDRFDAQLAIAVLRALELDAGDGPA
ncbi:helix-turn-helix domain-containing protein [Pseudonocardia sp.]|uniref:helix-turn-helix domain-containing protein n=1 Tax=Pseudonocardia sp. TaxID=60912 RepID=UPI003D118C02